MVPCRHESVGSQPSLSLYVDMGWAEARRSWSGEGFRALPALEFVGFTPVIDLVREVLSRGGKKYINKQFPRKDPQKKAGLGATKDKGLGCYGCGWHQKRF